MQPLAYPRYNAVAITFHWLVAALIIVQVPLGPASRVVRRGDDARPRRAELLFLALALGDVETAGDDADHLARVVENGRTAPRDHAARDPPLSLSKADQPCLGRVRPLAWCSRPRSYAALLEGALTEERPRHGPPVLRHRFQLGGRIGAPI